MVLLLGCYQHCSQCCCLIIAMGIGGHRFHNARRSWNGIADNHMLIGVPFPSRNWKVNFHNMDFGVDTPRAQGVIYWEVP